jgi:hypothetical protein
MVEIETFAIFKHYIGPRWPCGQCARCVIAKVKQRLQRAMGNQIFAIPVFGRDLLGTNPHWARVFGYGTISLRVIHKVDLCPSFDEFKMLMINTGQICRAV